MNNVMSVKTLTPLELSIDNKSSLLLCKQQVSNQDNNQSTPGKSTTMSHNKHLRHQVLLSNNSRTINLVPITDTPESS
jgi:hypothetical protein